MVTLALLFPIMRAMGDTGVPERFIGCVLGTAKGPRDLIFRSLDGKTHGKIRGKRRFSLWRPNITNINL